MQRNNKRETLYYSHKSGRLPGEAKAH